MTDDAWSSFTPAPATDPWASFTPAPPTPATPAAAAAKNNVAVDMAKSFGTGAALRQPASVIGAPRDVAGLITGPMIDGVLSVGNQVRSLLGLEPTVPTAEQREGMRSMGRGMTSNPAQWAGYDVGGGSADVQRQVEQNITGEWHKPQTKAGEYAQTIGEFAAPGAMPSRVARGAPTASAMVRAAAGELFGNVVAPALVSETAGQLTHGTAAEPWARVLGAAAGNVGTAAVRSANAPENVVRRATGDMTEAQWQAARDLAANQHGIRLSGPEAIAQATGGASALSNVMRVVEGSVDGRARSGPFFAARPVQVRDAVDQWLDQIAPQSATPSVLGPRARDAAGQVLDDVRQGVNAQTRPLYQAAEPQTLDAATFGPIAADPRFRAGLERLRGNAELGPEYAGMADNSVAVVDAVTKDMAARGEALATRSNPLYGPEAAALNTAGAANARTAARQAVPEYDAALQQQAQLRRDVLQPVVEGPVGRVAAATDTPSAGSALLPQNPMRGSGPETADAVVRLIAQDADATRGVVRQNLADRFGHAATDTMEGNREFAGAKFRNDVAGNDSRREVLDAVLNGIPGGPAATSTDTLLDVLQATGRRKPIGSATEFNRSLNAELSDGSLGAQTALAARSLGTSLITNAADAARRATMRRSIGTLADMFLDPNSVDLIRAAAARGAPVNYGEAIARTGGQIAPAIRSTLTRNTIMQPLFQALAGALPNARLVEKDAARASTGLNASPGESRDPLAAPGDDVDVAARVEELTERPYERR